MQKISKSVSSPYIVALIVALGEAALHGFLDLRWLELVLIPSLSFTLTKLVEDAYHWKPVREYAEPIRSLTHIPDELHDYITHSIQHHIWSMHSLSVGDGADCTYAEQIAIANNLVKRATTRLWTTTLDRPSRLWEQGYDYFHTQANLKIADDTDDLPRRARIVILEWLDLKDDMSNDNTRDLFLEFVKWHEDEKYELRFLATNSEQLRKNMAILHDSEPMTDFMLANKPSEFVYGRTSEMAGNRVRLKFIPRREPDTSFEAVTSYERVFINWWHRAKSYEQIIAQAKAETAKPFLENELTKEYGAEFQNAIAGDPFLRAVCQRISTAKEFVLAVDTADAKAAINLWSFKEEYIAFAFATAEAAKRHISAGRVFVVDNLNNLLDLDFREVLRIQVEAGIHLFIITKQDASDKHLRVDDFILVDDTFGFRLGDDQFDKNSLALRKHLIPKGQLHMYKEIAEALKRNAICRLSTSEDFAKFDSIINDKLKAINLNRSVGDKEMPVSGGHDAH